MKTKKIIYFLIATLIFIIIVYMFFVGIKPQGNPPGNNIIPTVTPVQVTETPSKNTLGTPPDVNQQYKNSFNKITSEEQATYSQWQKVAALRVSLPHDGQFFSLSYDYSTGSFNVVISKSSINKGDAEFDSFLKDNGILDRSWIHNLVTSYN